MPLRQSYARVAKRAAIKVGRYAHAKQFKRMNREIKFLRTRLGRVIRDIRRKTMGDEALAAAFAALPLLPQPARACSTFTATATETDCAGAFVGQTVGEQAACAQNGHYATVKVACPGNEDPQSSTAALFFVAAAALVAVLCAIA